MGATRLIEADFARPAVHKERPSTAIPTPAATGKLRQPVVDPVARLSQSQGTYWSSFLSTQHTSREIRNLRRDLDGRISKAEVDITLLKQDIVSDQERAAGDIGHCKTTCEKLASDLDGLGPLHDECARLREEFDRIGRQTESETAELNKNLKKTSEEVTHISAELDPLQKKIALLQDELKGSKEDADKAISQRIGTFETKQKDLERKVEDTSRDVKTLQEKYSSSAETEEALRADVNILKGKEKGFEEQLEQMKTEKKELDQKLGGLLTKQESNTKEIGSLQEKCRTFTEKEKVLQGELKELQATQKTTKEEQDKFKTETGQKLKRLQAQEKKTKDELSGFRETNGKLEQALDTLEKAKNKTDEDLKRLEAANKRMEEDGGKLRAHTEGELENLGTAKRQTDKKLDKLEAEKKATEDRLERLEAETKELEASKVAKQETDRELKKLKEEKNRTEGELERLKAKNKETEDKLSALEGRMKMLESRQDLSVDATTFLSELLSRKGELMSLLDKPAFPVTAAATSRAAHGAAEDSQMTLVDTGSDTVPALLQPETPQVAQSKKRAAGEIPQPDAKRRPPSTGQDLRSLILHFKDDYKLSAPSSDVQFIWEFFDSIEDVNMSKHIQENLVKLLPEFVSKRKRATRGKKPRLIDISDKITWKAFLRALIKVPTMRREK
ncbi:hypothetical protein QBC46DRAFT_349689 [Diplogelasinospora grovesii]|uniref:Uncharacterized protein n=1 Tax=Diplogelasinospora grovesii TaxID=303347 RepID=A0AAN6NGC8_9PEZI|nr:hypothetical protein QBC46DRAFT_349689 [Diplogelasinospora grovesii]